MCGAGSSPPSRSAEVETDPERRSAWLTFVVVGGGPTGVELAGQIGEIARDTLRRDFRSIDTRAARILLVETAERVLPQFPPRLSQRAARSLEGLGVTPLVGTTVVGIDDRSVTVDAAGESERLPARTSSGLPVSSPPGSRPPSPPNRGPTSIAPAGWRSAAT